jgi:hypothetical protein
MKNQDHELKQQQRQKQQELEQQLMDYKELIGLVGTEATADCSNSTRSWRSSSSTWSG